MAGQAGWVAPRRDLNPGRVASRIDGSGLHVSLPFTDWIDAVGAATVRGYRVLVQDRNPTLHSSTVISLFDFMALVLASVPGWRPTEDGALQRILEAINAYNLQRRRLGSHTAGELVGTLDEIGTLVHTLPVGKQRKYLVAITWLRRQVSWERANLTQDALLDEPGPITREWAVESETPRAWEYLAPSRSRSAHAFEYAGLSIFTRSGQQLAEIDGVDLTRRIIFEDKQASGVADDERAANHWAELHVYRDLVRKINAIFEGVDHVVGTRGRGARYGGPLPILSALQGIQDYVIRIEVPKPSVHLLAAVKQNVARLNRRYGKRLRFLYQFGAPPAKTDSPPSFGPALARQSVTSEDVAKAQRAWHLEQLRLFNMLDSRISSGTPSYIN